VASALSQVYHWARTISRAALLVTIALIGAIHLAGSSLSLSAQLVIALIRLAIGIPHGAIDHLISIPTHPRSRFFLYIAGYVGIAVVAGVAIATWNLVAFDLVLIMSGLHFGFGDASFINEGRSASSQKSEPLWVEILYALPAGFLPIVLPLTDHRTLSALERIRPALVNWSGTNTQALRTSIFILTAISLIALLLTKRIGLAVDISLLALLSIFAPPLVAFAIYFGLWHALRHTARLIPHLPKAVAFADAGSTRSAFIAAVVPGLYAVGGSFALAAALMIASPQKFSSSLLWSVLVIIWALTVPHMLSTARLDRASLKGLFPLR